MVKDTSQIRAITFPSDESCLVVAPPGYGKTYVMSHRIRYLIRSGKLNPPKRLLGLTFTNAAAAEMKKRVSEDIPHRQLENIDLGTIHSFCYQVLRAYGTYASVEENFAVIGDTEVYQIFRSVALELRLPIEQDVYNEIYNSFNKWVTERILKQNQNYKDEAHNTEFETIYSQYIEYCRGSNVIDFNHILLWSYELFVTNPNILEMYRAAYDYILVDEFQDTNPLQFYIISLLVEGNSNQESKLDQIPVFLFGDANQAIYQFLGATPENVNKGASRFNCQKLVLELNHRTNSPKILEISSRLHSEIPNREVTNQAQLTISNHEIDEAQLVIKKLKSIDLPLHRICIIAPNKLRLASIKKKCIEDQLPFVFIPDFSGSEIERNFQKLFKGLRALSDVKESATLITTVKSLLSVDEIDSGLQDVIKLIQEMARQYDYRFSSKSLDLRAAEFLNHLLLEVNWGQLVRQNVKDKVYISTIHGVKGLEFDYVIICGLENYVIPHSSVCVNQCNFGNLRSQIDEIILDSTRLLYVGVTRSIHDIEFYAVRQSLNGKGRKISCLLHPILSNLTSDRANFTQQICSYT